jgi:hypothetical protein
MTLRPSCRVYRGSDVRRAIDHVQGAAPYSITTKRAGNFHRGRDAAYFTFNEAYADECAKHGNPGGGMVILQDLPSRILKGSYDFGRQILA